MKCDVPEYKESRGICEQLFKDPIQNTSPIVINARFDRKCDNIVSGLSPATGLSPAVLIVPNFPTPC